MPPFARFSPATEEILAVAAAVAQKLDSGCIGSGHLALALLESTSQNEVTAYLLAKNGVKREEAELYARSQLENDPKGDKSKPKFSKSAQKALDVAAHESNMAAQREVAPEALLIGLLAPQKGAHVGQVLRPLGLDFRQLRRDWHKVLQSQNPFPFDHPLSRLDETGAKIVQSAQEIARKNGCGRINSGHVLLALCDDLEARYWIEQGGVSVEELKQKTRELLVSDGETIEARAKWDDCARAALERAGQFANWPVKIGPRFLLLGLIAPVSNAPIAPDDIAAQVLEAHADELRIAGFVFDKRAVRSPRADDWPFSWPIFGAMTLVYLGLGALILGQLPPRDFSPLMLFYFAPVVATALASRLLGLGKLHFNSLLALVFATIAGWILWPMWGILKIF